MTPYPSVLTLTLLTACAGLLAGQSRDPIVLTSYPEVDVWLPKISPDGQWVAYLSRLTYGTTTLRVRRIDGTIVRDLTSTTSTNNNLVHQFTWQQRASSTQSELVYVVPYGPYAYLNRTNPNYSGSVGVGSVSNANRVTLQDKPFGNVMLGTRWNSTTTQTDVFYMDLGGTGTAPVFLSSFANGAMPIDVSPAGTLGVFAAFNPNQTSELWLTALQPGGWSNPLTVTGQTRVGIDAGFLDDDDTLYESATLTNFVAPSYYLHLWNNWSPTLISNNAFIHAGEAFAQPGQLAVPQTDKQWLAVTAQELPPLPIGSVTADLVAITPPQQGGFVFLHRAATGSTVAEVTMDRAGTRVAYLKILGNDRQIEVVDLDRELTVKASRAGGQGIIDISIPCAVNEICVLAGAHGLAALPATLPGFRGQFELDNSYQTLHLAVGTGAPVTWSSTFPDTPAMVGIKLCYQAMRSDATITSGDFSRVAWLRWF